MEREDLVQILQDNLPQKVSRNEVLNYFIHNITDSRGPAYHNSLTSKEIVDIAIDAGKIIEGYSPLEINVSLSEQAEYTFKTRGSRRDSLQIRLINNKKHIIEAYENGVSYKRLSELYDCHVSTIKNFIRKHKDLKEIK